MATTNAQFFFSLVKIKKISHLFTLEKQPSTESAVGGAVCTAVETHLVLAIKIDDDIFEREGSLLAQARQHVLDELAVPGGCQRGAAVREVDTAVTPLHTEPTPVLRGAGTGSAVLQQ